MKSDEEIERDARFQEQYDATHPDENAGIKTIAELKRAQHMIQAAARRTHIHARRMK